MYPSYEVILQEYQELAELISGIQGIAEARELQDTLFIEANSVYLEEFIYRGGSDTQVDYYRFKKYKHLSNIYLWLDKGFGRSIYFEITNDAGECYTPLIQVSDLSSTQLHIWSVIDQQKAA